MHRMHKKHSLSARMMKRLLGLDTDRRSVIRRRGGTAVCRSTNGCAIEAASHQSELLHTSPQTGSRPLQPSNFPHPIQAHPPSLLVSGVNSAAWPIRIPVHTRGGSRTGNPNALPLFFLSPLPLSIKSIESPADSRLRSFLPLPLTSPAQA